MSKIIVFSILLLVNNSLLAQKYPFEVYRNFIKGDSLLRVRNYHGAIIKYNLVLKTSDWKDFPYGAYRLAKCYASINERDSAYTTLVKLYSNKDFSNYDEFEKDTVFFKYSIYPEWIELSKKIINNKVEKEKNYNHELISILDSIDRNDSHQRSLLKNTIRNYGMNSNEYHNQLKLMGIQDSLNLLKVTQIFDKYGWLGEDVVTSAGCMTLFITLQHGDLYNQEKYLPLLRNAVKNGIAEAQNVALLEDRINVTKGLKQKYGSQFFYNEKSQQYELYPVKKPKKLNAYRKEVGLEPIDDYLNSNNVIWIQKH